MVKKTAKSKKHVLKRKGKRRAKRGGKGKAAHGGKGAGRKGKAASRMGKAAQGGKGRADKTESIAEQTSEKGAASADAPAESTSEKGAASAHAPADPTSEKEAPRTGRKGARAGRPKGGKGSVKAGKGVGKGKVVKAGLAGDCAGARALPEAAVSEEDEDDRAFLARQAVQAARLEVLQTRYPHMLPEALEMLNRLPSALLPLSGRCGKSNYTRRSPDNKSVVQMLLLRRVFYVVKAAIPLPADSSPSIGWTDKPALAWEQLCTRIGWA
jgi:hypothetical protein